VSAPVLGAGMPRAVTARLALGVLEVQPGQRVVVHGGSSGVGTMAIQLLRAAGAHVIATGTREAKFALMRRAGAAEVLSTRDPAWPRALGTWTACSISSAPPPSPTASAPWRAGSSWSRRYHSGN